MEHNTAPVIRVLRLNAPFTLLSCSSGSPLLRRLLPARSCTPTLDTYRQLSAHHACRRRRYCGKQCSRGAYAAAAPVANVAPQQATGLDPALVDRSGDPERKHPEQHAVSAPAYLHSEGKAGLQE